MIHGMIQETDMDITHEIPETHTCLRATDKTIAMIHARDMDKKNDSRERRPEQQNRSVRFESPHRDKRQNRQNMNFKSRNAQH